MYIEPSGKFVQKKITLANDIIDVIEITDEPVSDQLKEALELNEDNLTRYATFDQYKGFSIFGDDKEGSTVKVLANGQIIKFTSDTSLEYGKYVWVCQDQNQNGEDGALIAISSISSKDPLEGKIEFYRLTANSQIAFGSTDLFETERLSTEIKITSSTALSSANFVNGDFIWQPSADEGLNLFRVCPPSSFLNAFTQLCESCPFEIFGSDPGQGCADRGLGNNSYLPSTNPEWFNNGGCSYYQNDIDTVFLCKDAELYVLPRDFPFD